MTTLARPRADVVARKAIRISTHNQLRAEVKKDAGPQWDVIGVFAACLGFWAVILTAVYFSI